MYGLETGKTGIILAALAIGVIAALLVVAGFVGGILARVFFLTRGYPLRRTYQLPALGGGCCHH